MKQQLYAPMVSFLMPTFGRVALFPHLVAEALYWYTQQEYTNKELVILNHAKEQTIVCNMPTVRVYNIEGVASLGDKMNMLVELAKGEVCLPFEDDDISLPWRATQAVQHLSGGYDYWTAGLWWFAVEHHEPVADGAGVGHNCSAFKRTPFLNAYAKGLTKGHDAYVHNWALRNLRCNKQILTDPAEISYFYRWGVADHLSGHGDMEKAYRRQNPGPPGTYELKPVIGRDYLKIHQAAVQKARTLASSSHVPAAPLPVTGT